MDGINIGDKMVSSRPAVTYKKGFHDEVKSSKMIYKSFGSTGLQVSLLGLGGSELALCYGISEEQEGINTVLEAVKSGINYIDTAPFYGHGKAEKVLGKALKNIPRDTYYLATKVGRYGTELQNMFDFSSSRVFKSVNESLDRLGIEYADILLAHDVEFAKNTDIIAFETLPTLQKIKESGKAKYIGITGYPVSTLKEIVDKSDIKLDVILSYCRCTLFDNTLRNYIPYFKEKGIAIVNAAVLGMGLLTNNGPPDWHPAGSELKAACEQAAKYCKVCFFCHFKVSHTFICEIMCIILSISLSFLYVCVNKSMIPSRYI
ncbi:L-galactose dehydrogenase-like isoform X1 [Stegodyphus dumicola]|uniref:L-galactose dehydrogenase-like isoform X1 n=1 Tax=Stegodyphus dumicola TaxID=202533 RepID=UPI0015A9520E|nr:L-galactose dehydrogenase-like isoform X1 [Stegodyphus dumicola]